MTQVTYDMSSPYGQTPQITNYLQYLDVWKSPVILSSSNDVLYMVEQKYKNRPDLLSYDLYNTTGYWWVFALRNPDLIKDPIYDLIPDVIIYLPDRQNLPKLMT